MTKTEKWAFCRKLDCLATWDHAKVLHAQEEVSNIYFSCLTHLSRELNEYHKVKWSERQYEKLLGYWLIFFLQVLHDRYLRVTSFEKVVFDRIPHDHVEIPIGKIVDYASSHSINANLLGVIQSLNDGGLSQLSWLPDSTECLSSFRTASFANSKVQIVDPYFVYHGSLYERLHKRFARYWSIRRTATPLLFSRRVTRRVSVDKDWRLRYRPSCNAGPADFLFNLVCIFLPAEFLEGFAGLRTCARRHIPNMLYSANGIHTNLAYKFIAAEHDQSTKLLTHQHGGGYGWQWRSLSEEYERRVSNVFYTWGWVEDQTTQPLPVPPRIKSVNVAKRHGVLFKYTRFTPYVLHIGEFPMGLSGVDEYLRDTISFLKPLGPVELEIGYPSYDYGLQEERALYRAGIVAKEKCREEYTYAIHLFHFPSTGWLETLAANLPTICLYNPKVSLFRPEAQPFFDCLLDVGILHTDPRSAASKVLEIYADPSIWWSQPEVQFARENFVFRFARLETNWADCWNEEFCQSNFVNILP